MLGSRAQSFSRSRPSSAEKRRRYVLSAKRMSSGVNRPVDQEESGGTACRPTGADGAPRRRRTRSRSSTTFAHGIVVISSRAIAVGRTSGGSKTTYPEACSRASPPSISRKVKTALFIMSPASRISSSEATPRSTLARRTEVSSHASDHSNGTAELASLLICLVTMARPARVHEDVDYARAARQQTQSYM